MPEFWGSDGSHPWPFSSGLKAAIERSVIVNPWVIVTQEVCVQPKSLSQRPESGVLQDVEHITGTKVQL